MSEQDLTLRLQTVKETELFHQLTVTPGLSAKQIDSLQGKAPFVQSNVILNRQQFVLFTGQMAGWPYENVVSESSDSTVFAIPDALFDYIRESTPEVVARKLARTLHAKLELEQ